MATQRFTLDALGALVRDALGVLGYSGEETGVISRHLIAAETGGARALGVMRVGWIAGILEDGAPLGDPSVVERSSGGCVMVDGRGGIGYLGVERALAVATDLVRRDGVAVAGVRDVFLTGVLRSYCDDLARAGLASVIMSSAAPSLVAPAPGGRRVLGTNPIAIGVPGEPFPLLFDTSATDLPFSEVVARARAGTELPPGIGLDDEGRPTTDAREVIEGGALLGWAGHRGFGMAAAVQAIGMMVGAPPVPNGLDDCGLLVVIVDPVRLTGAGGGIDIGGLLTAVAGATPSGDGRLPGQHWHDKQRHAAEQGVEIEADVAAMLSAYAGRASP